MSTCEELNLSIPGSQSSPSIRADWKAGVVVMSGESYPENSFELYDQLIRWIGSFLANAERSLTLELHLNYLNTSSIRFMIDIFDLLQTAFENGKEVLVQWMFDERYPRSAELGSEFKEDYIFPFLILSTNI
ncbi:biofilm regulation phosphoprotein SiaC [Synechococcus sp. BA-132 BA5]|nr:biofilm regulation phosphoprotein SiaC [Synechococcus sp. BA-132 BA5]